MWFVICSGLIYMKAEPENQYDMKQKDTQTESDIPV